MNDNPNEPQENLARPFNFDLFLQNQSQELHNQAQELALRREEIELKREQGQHNT